MHSNYNLLEAAAAIYADPASDKALGRLRHLPLRLLCLPASSIGPRGLLMACLQLFPGATIQTQNVSTSRLGPLFPGGWDGGIDVAAVERERRAQLRSLQAQLPT